MNNRRAVCARTSFGTQVYRRRHGRCVRSGKVPQRPRGRRAFRLKASRRKEFMASKTVSEFAQELKVAAKTLLAQLRAAGVNKASETDELSETDKTRQPARRAHAIGSAQDHRHAQGTERRQAAGRLRPLPCDSGRSATQARLREESAGARRGGCSR